MVHSSYISLLSLASLVVARCGNSSAIRTHRTKGSLRSSHSSTISAASGSATNVDLAASRVASSVPSPSSSSVAPVASKSLTTPSNSSHGLPASGTKLNGIHIGWLPDDGSGGGQSETMAQINSALGGSKSSAYGYYAQAQSGTLFDGSQLLARMDDIKAAGAIFQPAVMPTGGWKGLTFNDPSQAVAIAKVMQKFVDQGLTVWLRFAHEVNYYQTDGTYQGDVHDFKEGWAVVAAAIKQYSPKTKMWFTPNVASLAQYDQYYPDDPKTVDYIGIDFYPQNPNDPAQKFVAIMKPFHDKYTNEHTKFAIGETGLGGAASMAQRLAWMQDSTSPETAKAMPNYIALSWFNYHKGYDFRLANVAGDSITKSYLN